jgi:hypothetical protein
MTTWVGLCSSARWGARGASRGATAYGELAELFRSRADLVIMDREAAGSGGCSSTFHGRLGAGVTISSDAIPAVFRTGLLTQHPICNRLFRAGRGVQGNATQRRCQRSLERSGRAARL